MRLAPLPDDPSLQGPWVYLDSNVLIDLRESWDGWVPPPQPTRSDLQRIAATRLRLYGYAARCPHWYLVTSGWARREITIKDPWDWTLGTFFDVDQAADAPDPAVLAREVSRLEQVGLRGKDAAHLARVNLRPWIPYLVTSDDQFRKKAKGLAAAHLTLVSAIEAADFLKIQPGEQPPLSPPVGSALGNGPKWWVP